jgi:hypothetical protein
MQIRVEQFTREHCGTYHRPDTIEPEARIHIIKQSNQIRWVGEFQHSKIKIRCG